ncbi:hypothetical protein J1605_010296 [Eschrichtius robustus]|uniref:Uncharacterized protein n=1 Tax=Eschrichtius robustus TaxID=9764 RepID=A0AB34GTL3_ESCRO|nr:hypothetical protein J1605_010296 [Eschrichtius robustus]
MWKERRCCYSLNNEILRNFSSIFRFNKEPEKTENVENNLRSSHRRRRNEESDDDLDFDIDLEDTEEDNQMD